MANKQVVPIGRYKARRVVGIPPKNMTRDQRDTMISYHLKDIRDAMNANEYGDIGMYANRIALLADLNKVEMKQQD